MSEPSHVVRRKTPRHDGSRYFNATGPAQRDLMCATQFTEEEANAARRVLKEPHLWDVVPINEAVEIEQKALAAHQAEQRPHYRRNASTAALLALASMGIATTPLRRS